MLYGDCAKQSRYAHGRSRLLSESRRSPQVVAVDEIGTAEDIHAIEYAMQCGCKLIASVHGMDMEEAARKPVLGEMIRRKMFERYIVLGNDGHPGKVKEIYDERGSVLCRK